jgi:hypothetical protein
MRSLLQRGDWVMLSPSEKIAKAAEPWNDIVPLPRHPV